MGIHPATLAEIKNRFANSERRMQLFVAMEKVVLMLRSAQCSEIFLDGSYVSTKPEPGDYDLCWDPTGVVPTKELKRFLQEKRDRKKIHLGDIFPRLPEPPYFTDHVIEWQTDRDENRKGIVRIVEKHND